MTDLIVAAIVSLVTGLVKVAAEAGQPVDLQKVMATAAAQAGVSMSEYNKQLEEQRALFPDG